MSTLAERIEELRSLGLTDKAIIRMLLDTKKGRQEVIETLHAGLRAYVRGVSAERRKQDYCDTQHASNTSP